MKSGNRKSMLLAAAVSAGLAHAALATTGTWSGATDNSWLTASNWGTAAAPNATGDDAIFNTAGAGNLNIIANTGTLTVRTLQFNANATNPVTINVGNATTAQFFIINGQTGDDVVVAAGNHVIQGTGTTAVAEVRIGAGSGAAEGFTFNIADGTSLNINARINQQNSGNLYFKNGGGTLTLGQNNGGSGGWNFTGGGFTVNAGVLVLGNNGATGNSGNKFIVNNGAILELQANYGSSGSILTLNNGATLRSRGGNRSINQGAGSIALGGTVTIDVVDNSMILQQDLAGSGGFTKQGAGSLQLTAGGANTQNSYTGATTINAGTVVLGANASIATSPTVTVNSGAALDVSAVSGWTLVSTQTLRGGGTVYGNATVAGTIAPGASAGTLNFNNNLTLAGGGTLNFELSNNTSSGNDFIHIGGQFDLSGSTTLNLSRLNSVLGEGTYTLMDYGSLGTGGGTITLPTGPSRQTLTLTIGATSTTLGVSGTAGNLTWVGDGTANVWDHSTNNFLNNGVTPDHFFDLDAVTFDDTGSNSPDVNLQGALIPASVTVSNTSKDYVFSGSGSLAGGGLTKTGGGKLTIANTATNTLTSMTISGGTVQLGDGVTSGAGDLDSTPISNDASLILNRPGDYTFANPVSGGAGGVIEKQDSGVATFSGNSTHTGAVLIDSGTVKPTLSSSFGATTAGTVTVSGGALIDLGSGAASNALNFGTRLFKIAGDGSGSGAIFNSGTQQLNAFQRVQLTGNASIGGTGGGNNGRIDIRTGDNSGSLDLAGFTLTKRGDSQFSIVGTTVSDGNIDVQQGTLSIETTSTVSGSGQISYASNTVAQFFSVTGLVDRPVVVNGTGVQFTNGTSTGASTLASSVLLHNDISVTSGNTGTLIFSGVISDDGTPRSLTKAGTDNSRMELRGFNTYTGTTFINTGLLNMSNSATGNVISGDLVIGDGVGAANTATLTSSNSNKIADTSNVTIKSDGVWNTNGTTSGRSETIATLNSTDATSLIRGFIGGTGTFTTIVVSGNGNSSYAGVLGDNLNLTKSGTGSMGLSGNNSQTGSVTVNDGTLSLVTGGNNNIPNAIAITVGASGNFDVTGVSGGGGFQLQGGGTQTLTNNGNVWGGVTVPGGRTVKGTGVFNGGLTVQSGGNVAPGNSVGSFSTTTLSLDTANLNFELDGTGADSVNVTNTDGLTLAGVSTFNLTDLGGLTPGTYTLIDYAGTPLADLSHFNLPVGILSGFTISLVNDVANTSVDLSVIGSTVTAAWNVDSDGNWSLGSNWTGGTAPNGVDHVATFGSVITAPRVVTVDAPQTVGTINFDNAQSYTIAGSSTLTLDVSSGQAGVNVLSGSHTISAPVVLNKDTTFTSAAGSGVALTGNLSAAGKTITKAGDGTVQFENVRAAALHVGAGSARISTKGTANSDAGTSVVGSLIIDSGANLDLANNSMIVDYSGSVGTQVTDVRGHLRNGRLTSSSATATTRLGYGDNAVLNKSTFAGQSVDTSSVLVKYTYAGDADLDGDADGVDIGTWATNFTGELGGTGSAVWTQGDWDYDGDVDGVDAGLWAQAFTGELGGNGLGSVVVDDPNIAPGAAAILRGMGVTVVPEPVSLGLLAGFGALATIRRRRRR